MTTEELISRMNELSDRLFAQASYLIGKESNEDKLAAMVLMNVAQAIDDVFDDFDIDDCEGEA